MYHFARKLGVLLLVGALTSACQAGDDHDGPAAGPAGSESSTGTPSATRDVAGEATAIDDDADASDHSTGTKRRTPRTPTSRATSSSPASESSPSPADSRAPAPAAANTLRWVPRAATTWQYNIGGSVDLSVKADAFVLDSDETTAAQVRQLHNAGKKAVCYINAGAWEEWRADANNFPASVRGANMDGWPGEKWLDIRKTSTLWSLMRQRTVACANKGFDGVDFDNVDGYANKTGFPLTSADQLTYNKGLASIAHSLGLAVGLKNDVDQIKALQPSFDFAVNEQCGQYNECGAYAPFVAAKKPVLRIEYGTSAKSCGTKYTGLSTIVKHEELDSWRIVCP